MIAGILEPDEGKIYVNNVALKGIKLSQYRSYLGHSLTEEYPFEGTLLDNITFGNKDISMEDVYWALEKVSLSEFVKEIEKFVKEQHISLGKKFNELVRSGTLAQIKD